MPIAMVRNWKTVFLLVKGALMRRGRTEHEAEDLVQEAWIRFACYEQKKPVAKPEAFLMRTALNLSTDSYRTARNRVGEVPLDEDALIDPTPDVEATLLAREQAARLYECVVRLDRRTRDIFVAHRIDGLSYLQIAQHHGVSVSAVEKHIAKATLMITSWMEGWWP